MKKLIIIITILSLSCLMLPAANVLAADKTVIAEVNGEAIYRAEFDHRLDLSMAQITQAGVQPTADEQKQIKDAILSDLIEYKLLLQEATKQGVTATQAEVDAEINELKKNFVNENGFLAALKQSGVSLDEFTKGIHEGIVIQNLLEKQVGGQVKVTDAETRAFYDKNTAYFEQEERIHARHILIKVDPNAGAVEKDKARKKAEEIIEYLKKGGNFNDLAVKYSEDTSRLMGGDLGWFTKGRMVKPFEEAAFKLKKGEVSGIVETQFGYHIIKVEDYQPAEKVPYAEVKDMVAEGLLLQKKQEAAKKYVANLMKKANIKKYGF